jgi:prolyl 4-hydroxylase
MYDPKEAPINDLKKVEKLVEKKKKYFPSNFKCRVINEYPYIVKINNLLSDEEVSELLEMSKGKFQRSNLMKDGVLYYDDQRTSSTAYIFQDGLPDKYSKNIERFIKRICMLLNCSRSQLEVMAVRYKTGEQFDKHVDYFEDHEVDVLDKAGNRVFTVFIYLNDLSKEDGGTTEFTKLGIRSRPKKGDALFWWNQDLNTGEMLPETEHRGNPVLTEGVVKFGLNVWQRSKEFY